MPSEIPLSNTIIPLTSLVLKTALTFIISPPFMCVAPKFVLTLGVPLEIGSIVNDIGVGPPPNSLRDITELNPLASPLIKF